MNGTLFQRIVRAIWRAVMAREWFEKNGKSNGKIHFWLLVH
jgi:hypothetical protein